MSAAVRTDAEYQRYRLSHPFFVDVDRSTALYEGTPKRLATVRSSEHSIGLQIVDVYLWIVNRMQSEKSVPRELRALASTFLRRAHSDGISLDGMRERWATFENRLPSIEAVDPAVMAAAQESIDAHREKVRTLGTSND